MTRWSTIEASEGHQHQSGGASGVQAGPWVFLSAIRGVDPETQQPLADPTEQAEQLFRNIEAALAPAGGTLADVVKVGIFMRDLHRDRPVFNRVWKARFGDRGPARFAVEVADFGGEGDGSLYLVDVTALLADG